MRTILLALALVSACAPATGPGVVNVSAVRHQVNDSIHASDKDRSIYSMGKVTPDRAVVYTEAKDGTKAEEVWVKSDAGWKQESATKLSQVQ